MDQFFPVYHKIIFSEVQSINPNNMPVIWVVDCHGNGKAITLGPSAVIVVIIVVVVVKVIFVGDFVGGIS